MGNGRRGTAGMAPSLPRIDGRSASRPGAPLNLRRVGRIRRTAGRPARDEVAMITIRKSNERGHFDSGWLDTYHTFSFADYHDPRHMGFSVLRVINQDRVQPGRGFGTHGHRNMEIISYVLEGVLEHRDGMGNGSRILPGEVQFMSAGTGVTHSEFNASDREPVHLLQMWILPERRGTPPRYDQKKFPEEERRGRLRLLVSPDGRDGSIVIGQNVDLYGALLPAGAAVEHRLAPGRSAWLHVALGRLRLNDCPLGPGDGAGIRDEERLVLTAEEDTEIVLFDLP